MSILTSKYWKIPVFAQKFMGVWPYDDNLYDKVMRFVVCFSICALIVPLGARLLEEIGHDIRIVIENLVGEMYASGGFLKFTMQIQKRHMQKEIYEMISRDYGTANDKEELAIMREHSEIGRVKAIAYTMCCCSTAAIFISIPVFYPLLDYISPLENASRPREFPIYAEYFINLDNHYHPLLLLMAVTGTLSMIVFVTYDVAFAMCVQHVSSLFDVIGLRLRRASAYASDPSIDQVDAEKKVYFSLLKAIELHQTVIKNVDYLERTYFLSWLAVSLLNVTGIGGGLLVVMMNLHSTRDLIRYGIFFTTIFIHMYFIFLPGQNIIDGGLKVFDACYETDWYRFSSRSQVLIKIMMVRSIRPLYLTGGKLFPMSMETYAKVSQGIMKALPLHLQGFIIVPRMTTTQMLSANA
ncbi:hypothetical protein QAD02_012094 [Eretmocerus hayati]|uniref:Uncharacterized protein n=1 Tax=Eretmocerus hayati TaxID=131215 RepID=A0ACC2NYV8_9HYME|nr:hypothetical protein QAD02_012094 [Eretmocerus hayati]